MGESGLTSAVINLCPCINKSWNCGCDILCNSVRWYHCDLFAGTLCMILISVWIWRFQAFRECACDSRRIYSWKHQEAAQRGCWPSILGGVQDSMVLVCYVSLLSDLTSIYFLLWICLLLWTRHRSSLCFLEVFWEKAVNLGDSGFRRLYIDFYGEYLLPKLLVSVFSSTSTPLSPPSSAGALVDAVSANSAHSDEEGRCLSEGLNFFVESSAGVVTILCH